MSSPLQPQDASESVTERPFQVRLRPEEALYSEAPADASESAADEPELSLEEIEAAYLLALDAADAADALVAPLDSGLLGDPEETGSSELPVDAETAHRNECTAMSLACSGEEATADRLAEDNNEFTEEPATQRTTSTQVLEALLFVGGDPLSSKRMAELLGGSTTPEQVDEWLTALNRRYLEQQRPYEIQVGEGGYRLLLREEFEPVRRKVYGQGPREVKLGQDALEILAFVAYQQPVTRAEIEDVNDEQAGSMIRQLLRRELIQLERGDASEPDRYRTTGRFLELFGLRSLADLPRSRDFDFK